MQEGMEKELHPALTPGLSPPLVLGGEIVYFPQVKFGVWTSLWLNIFLSTILSKLWVSSMLDGREDSGES